MKKTNIKRCPECKSVDIFDTHDRWPESVHDLSVSKEIPEPSIPVYQCRPLSHVFLLVNYKVCDKCGSVNFKKNGPFAKRKLEGELTDQGPMEIHFYCYNCEEKWTEQCE